MVLYILKRLARCNCGTVSPSRICGEAHLRQAEKLFYVLGVPSPESFEVCIVRPLDRLHVRGMLLFSRLPGLFQGGEFGGLLLSSLYEGESRGLSELQLHSVRILSELRCFVPFSLFAARGLDVLVRFL